MAPAPPPVLRITAPSNARVTVDGKVVGHGDWRGTRFAAGEHRVVASVHSITGCAWATDSTLARVMKMVEEAQTQKSPTQQMTERFERWFVTSLLPADALLIIVPPLFGVPFHGSYLRLLSMLVVASTCALALGTPAAVLDGVAQAARNGVLGKGGAHLENLGRLNAIAFDKTGTLTHGWPEVTEVIAFEGDSSQILSLAAALESRLQTPSSPYDYEFSPRNTGNAQSQLI